MDEWRGSPLSSRASSGLLPIAACPGSAEHLHRLTSLWGALASYRQVHVIEATSGASGVTMRAFGMFREFGGAVHGSTHTPSSSMS
jgi:hypothetical protein